MTSSATLLERLRRAAGSAEPERDVAVVLSEFVDDGGVEPVDDPFHPAQRHPNTGLVATMASTPEVTVTLVRGAAGVIAPPQRHSLPIAVAVIHGRLAVDIFTEINPPEDEFSRRQRDRVNHAMDQETLVDSGDSDQGIRLEAPASDDIDAAAEPAQESNESGEANSETGEPTETELEPRPSELADEGATEVEPEEVHVIEGDVIHRTRFLPDGKSGDASLGLAIHVIIGDLAAARRLRWVDGMAHTVMDSLEYPLTGATSEPATA